MSTLESSLIVSVALLGAILGAFMSGAFCDFFGRKRVIVMNDIPFLLSILVSTFAYNSTVIIIGRFFVGVCIGMASVAPGMYLAELSPSWLRGSLGAFNQFSITLGLTAATFVGYWLVWFFGAEDGYCWRYMFGSGSIIVVLHFVRRSPQSCALLPLRCCNALFDLGSILDLTRKPSLAPSPTQARRSLPDTVESVWKDEHRVAQT